MRIYHHHKGTPEFQRRISYVLDHDGQKVQYAAVQYLFEGGNEILFPSYRRTQKSTLSRIQIPGKPKNVVSVLHDEAGGSLGASSMSELPHNYRQNI